MYANLKAGDRVRLGSRKIRVLITEQEIRARVAEIGGRLREELSGSVPVFIGLLNGGFVFASDLIREYGEAHEVDFLKVSRYDRKRRDATAIRVMHDLRSDIRDRDIVLVEGIRARGTKIQYVDSFLRLHQPKSLTYCSMIEPAGAQLSVPLDESGIRIDNEFVVGYGLDFEEHYRNLPFIGVMDANNSGTSQ